MVDPLIYLYNKTGYKKSLIKSFHTGEKYAIIEMNNGWYGVCALTEKCEISEIPEIINLDQYSDRVLYQCYLNAIFNLAYQHLPSSSALDNLPFHQYKNIVMVGMFRPLLKRYHENGIFPVVFDMHVNEPGVTPNEEMPGWLKKSDLVIITATSVTNKTFTGISELLSHRPKCILAGPSTILHPELFLYIPNGILSGMLFSPSQPELINTIKEGFGTQEFKKYGKKVDIYPDLIRNSPVGKK